MFFFCFININNKLVKKVKLQITKFDFLITKGAGNIMDICSPLVGIVREYFCA